MDPNANLEELRRLVARLLALTVEEAAANVAKLHADAVRAAELVEALDGWLSKRGFLPRAWDFTEPERAHAEIEAASAPAALLTPTRNAFLAAYRAKVATFGWARDTVRLNHFMLTVEQCLAGGAILWEWDSPFALAAFREIGCKGKFTLKALRALP